VNFQNVAIEAMTYSLPEEVVSSEQIETQLSPLYDRLGLKTGRLELMTGIKERRFWPSTSLASEAAANAGLKLLQQEGVPAENVDLLVHSSVCRDRLEPATASYVHRIMDLPGSTQIMDISNACLGFLNAVIMASGMIESGQIRRAIIVSAENGKPLVDKTIAILNEGGHTRQTIKPYFANLTIGASAVAWSICHKDEINRESPILGFCEGHTDTSFNQLCEGDTSGDDLIMQTDSEELLHAGISVAQKAWDKFSNTSDWKPASPELLITHQVGKAHTHAVFEALCLDPSKNFSSYKYLGNCGASSLPITYALACESNTVNRNKKTVLMGIGSGLSSIMLSLNSSLT
jgi:3-oxoacyl-[acyl-carrier-protein] synthase-3